MTTTTKKMATIWDAKDFKNATRVSTRDWMRNFTGYKNRMERTGEMFVITNQDKDELVVQPLPQKKKYTIKDLMKFRFSGPKNLSKNIDKIVYGL